MSAEFLEARTQLRASVQSLPVSDACLAQLEKFLNSLEAGLPLPAWAVKVWRYLSLYVLHPGHEFAAHQRVLQAVYKYAWPVGTLGPFPLWVPSTDDLTNHTLTAFLRHFEGDAAFEAARSGPSRECPLDPTHDFPLLHALSVRDPERFFRAVLLGTLHIPFHSPPHRILDFDPNTQNPDTAIWLPGAQLNIAHCALSSTRSTHRVPARTHRRVGATGQGDIRTSGKQGSVEMRESKILRSEGPTFYGNSDSMWQGGHQELWGEHACDPGRPAIVWAEESTPTELRVIAMGELRAVAAQVAQAVRQRVQPGDAVGLILPMTPLAVACYLGIILAGGVVASIADSFASEEVATRLRIAKAQLMFTQDFLVRGGKHLPLYSRVAVAANAPPAVVLPCLAWGASTAASVPGVQLRMGDSTWADFLLVPSTQQPPQPTKHPLQPNQPAPLTPPSQSWWLHSNCAADACNILFSSGTTGEPKAIVWSHSTPLRCAVDGWAHQGIKPGDVCCWPTSLGWMMGPWLVFAAFLNGGTLALFNGSPLGRDFGQFLATAKVNLLGLVPSMVKAWRHSGCMQGLDWPHLKVISSTGEASSPDDSHWLMALTRYRAPIIEYCGGTELGGAYITGTTLQPCCPSTFSTPAIGTQVVLLTPPHAPPPTPAPGHTPGVGGLGSATEGGSTGDGTVSSSSSSRPATSTTKAWVGGDDNITDSGSGALTHSHRSMQVQSRSPNHVPGNYAQQEALSDRPLAASPHKFGNAAEAAIGEVALVAPTLGASQYLLNKDHFKAYYAGMPCLPYPPPHSSPGTSSQGQQEPNTVCVPLRRHGDELQRLPGGYYTALGRVDDTMNLGGIKVASVELERCVLENVEGVLEAAAVGVPNSGGGPEQLVLFLVLKEQQQTPRQSNQLRQPDQSSSSWLIALLPFGRT